MTERAMTNPVKDRILAELIEINEVLLDDRLLEEDRAALQGAQQALRNLLDPHTWEPASEIFYRIGARPKTVGRSQH
ncbi:hypothetical protein ACVIGB_000369 [Bradyrhizobium sp. USDA 4341]